ncbi:MAG TPA: hypothetical protein VFR58_04455 [Flavisolibacter sp.]|nr:hypothetical protein [Flavisolibacter sp.]
MKTIYQECADIVRDLVGHEYLYFDTAVEVKTSPHSYPFAAWAVCVSPAGELYLMDNNEEWHAVDLGDNNGALVIGSLYQRLKLMRIQYAKAS